MTAARVPERKWGKAQHGRRAHLFVRGMEQPNYGTSACSYEETSWPPAAPLNSKGKQLPLCPRCLAHATGTVPTPEAP